MSGMSTHSSPIRAEDGLRAGRDHLIRYGGEFPDFLVERAEGSWLETGVPGASSSRTMAWRSRSWAAALDPATAGSMAHESIDMSDRAC